VFYKQHKLRFSCTGCGDCCHGNPESHYVAASGAEIERIRRHLGIGQNWLRRRYLERIGPQEFGIRILPEGKCSFLGADGKCSIYSLRPLQCRTYPFWPEIVMHAKDWQREAKKCEGINRGNVVPVDKIKQALLKHQND